MNKVFLLLGANLGEPLAQLHSAAAAIKNRIGSINQESRIYASEAWGVLDQPPFLNQVLDVNTELSALSVLDRIQEIEHDLGRRRLEKWGARLIDIDILYYNDEIIQQERLSVPHPYIAQRKFTLIPLVEIAADFIHPILLETNESLLTACDDALKVQLLNPNP
ncbi:2-amino-4-hydroxy-6-hydroxymethyldihydropteridine diphosphokinase [Sphingobacterium paludis]|jgi:2-amino-4-hydroxy-6-hydroxymethyldihydropteridine diphosphokinase|uniref:2-amino-4-hydroxy-6-hydroxymethyldihydropteridine pyrophosphokinase n=1 Tax=Sphingobacterium paludis TaxID=1476465 RepID=A0A4R7D9X5_9SPHI|nr:2-amino-4-hydroxy-6-hydroxymethyldihydropteridine diphosphokinase [Sphingobacterium paludis]TDS17172.1 2-amino-4-hydroxy-6-hydroxymethyldihydropteridine diphosphokinase [Sphingobacterium paludis]